MKRTLLLGLSLLGTLVVGLGLLSAQVPALTPDDLTLRPGDTITWSPSSPHRVQFGGPPVTAFTDVQKVLKNIVQTSQGTSSPLNANSQGVAIAKVGATVTATVKDDAATLSGVPEFSFTAGAHPTQMVTVPFKIMPRDGRPVRNMQTISANPLKWLLKTPQGNKNLHRSQTLSLG